MDETLANEVVLPLQRIGKDRQVSTTTSFLSFCFVFFLPGYLDKSRQINRQARITSLDLCTTTQSMTNIQQKQTSNRKTKNRNRNTNPDDLPEPQKRTHGPRAIPKQEKETTGR
ncbi:hypothetical protein BDV32DRAFT_131212 [Aspergillus pseudonomiae]|nr:hypothetical protein BDV32DRAFT_131212 [Aspergillus pseudonomiae]